MRSKSMTPSAAAPREKNSQRETDDEKSYFRRATEEYEVTELK